MTDQRKAHWDDVYATCPASGVSWYEARPHKSLALIQSTGVKPHEAIIDVGGGASFLVDELLSAGFTDVTVLDVSSTVLSQVRARLSEHADAVTLVHHDVTSFRPERRYAIWHDRAVFHFLMQVEDRVRYREVLRQAVRPTGYVLIATFGPSGPERCSGLEVRRYDEATLAAELGPEFTLVSSSLEVHTAPAGLAQQFLYCSFQMPRST